MSPTAGLDTTYSGLEGEDRTRRRAHALRVRPLNTKKLALPRLRVKEEEDLRGENAPSEDPDNLSGAASVVGDGDNVCHMRRVLLQFRAEGIEASAAREGDELVWLRPLRQEGRAAWARVQATATRDAVANTADDRPQISK